MCLIVVAAVAVVVVLRTHIELRRHCLGSSVAVDRLSFRSNTLLVQSKVVEIDL